MGEEPSRVFIAGATGYLGGYLTDEFVKRGYRVDALSRTPSGASRLSQRGANPVVAQATQPTTLKGCFDGVDTVVSSLGITRQKDGLSYNDVDFQANLNLLRAAETAGVRRFVYVSVYNGERIAHTAMVGAKERFVAELRRSSTPSLVIRPTGFFSDMDEFLQMARNGRGWVFGKGDQRLNPIHGADLAEFIANAVEQGQDETSSGPDLPVGGPDEFSMREIMNLAFESLGRRPRVSSVPMWLVGVLERVLPRTTPQSVYGQLEMLLAASHYSMTAPGYGSRHLADHYARVVAESSKADGQG